MKKGLLVSSFLIQIALFGAFESYSQTYCTPTYGAACSSQDFINNFTFGSISNLNSGCNGGSNNYMHYTALTTTVTTGSTYTVTVQSGPSYAQGGGVWIDYNQDGDFDDAGEMVYATPYSSQSLFTGVVTIPQGVLTGAARMRVRCKYAGTIQPNESCNSFSYGETEDYTITINAGNPNISFTVNTNTTCVTVPVTFTNTSTDPNVYAIHWNYADGSSFIDTVPSTPINHAYTTPGLYNAYIQVYDASGNFLGGDSKSISIQPGTTGTFNMSNDTVCPNEAVNFDPGGNPGFVKWYMSNGFSSTNYSLTYAFPTLGTYSVYCICNTACGVDSIQKVIKVLNTVMPDGEFYFNPSPSVCPNTYVYFNPSVYPGTHLWDFGDAATSTLVSPNHKYTALGTYTISHTITNLCGNQTVKTHTISIDNTTYPSNANFNYNPGTPLCPGIQINFNSNNWEGQWSWNFGDGNTATGQNPKHTYSVSGTYTVTHTITNGCGNTVSTTQVLVIDGSIVPDAVFSMNPNPSCPGDIISYYPNEQFGINYLWNFGDGYTSSLKNPSHQYASVGTYTVTHMVTNFCNRKDTDTLVMNVNGSLPIFLGGNMNAWPMPACPTQPVQFNANNWGFALYAWNFGDGTVDSTNYPNVIHSYSAAGTYTASVNISNNCGSDSMIFLTVNIATAIPFPNFTLNANPQIACPDQTVNLNAPWGYPSYSWNMGDGSPVLNTTTEYISYSYTATGSYPVSVKVTDFCNRDTTYRDTISVVNASTFCLTGGCTINHWANNPSCPNQSVSFNADQGYAWYEWLFGDGSSMATSNFQTSHTYTATGVYNYSLTITNFCGVDTTVYNSVTIDNTMQVPPWVNVYPNPDVACPGQEIQFSTDNSYNSYFWNFGDGYSAFGTANVTHTYTAAAVYNVSVTITNACGNATTISNSVNVNVNAAFPNWMSLINSPDPSCPNSPVILETLPGYVSYNWHFGDGDSLISSTGKVMHVYTAPGIYHASVEVTNSCGNSVTLYKTVTINSNVTISYVDLFIPANPACVGDVVFMNAGIGGPATAGFTFVWNFGDGSPQDTTVGVGTSHTYTAMGVYNVSVTAFNACGNSKSNSKIVTINNTSVPYLNPWTFGVLTESGQPVSAVCPGDILVFYFEGINSNNLWNFGDGYTANAIDLFVRADGMTITTVKHAYVNTGSFNYSLSLGNNCGNNSLLSKSINVTGNMLINGGFMIEPPTSSLGYTTCGLIDFVAFGGNDFDWDFGDGDTLSTISPTVGHSYVNPGNYTVRVTITNGCGNSATYVKTLTISGQGGTSVNSNSSSPTCFGGANGSATAVVSGGQAPYTYIWYNALNQPISSNVTAAGLSAGTYVVSVTDANGCTGSSVSVLNNPAAITFSTSATQSTCGGASGTATVSGITGGSGPYSYAWTNGQTASTATGLAMGNYGVVITDANSCTSSGNASVSENGAVVSLASATNATCNASTNGSISINVTSGTPPYTFAWSNSATTQNISGIAAGNYSVVVTDSAGCLSTLNGSVTAPAAISVNVTPVVSPTCGNFDGSAIANVSGGVSPYSYLWPNAGNKTTQTVTGLPAGTYTVNVTDANGCTQAGTITLSNSNAPNVSAVVNDVTCNGSANGTIDLTVTGGTSPYLYNWNVGPPQTNNQDLNSLAPGLYFVSIQDAAGCFSVRSYNIAQPAVLTASVSSAPATCGSNNGTASAAPAGGNAPYTYLWTGGSTAQSPSGLALGNYTVLVTDSKGCTVSGTTTVTATTVPIEICMVTVDSTSTKNVIVWEKAPSNANTDSVRIYRLVGVTYTKVGTVPYTATSWFTDTTNGVNPNITSYKYKIETADTCGGISAKSQHHKTIHNTANIGVGGVVNLIWDQYEGFSSTYYRIWRDSTGMNPQLLDSVPWGNLTYTDLNPPALTDTVSYLIEVVAPGVCTASIKDPSTFATNLNSSKSNVFRVWDTTVTSVNVNALAGEIVVYPNPNHGSFSVAVGKTPVKNIRVMDVLGREVASSVSRKNKTFQLSIPYAPGVYVLKIDTDSGIINKKFIIE